MNERKQGPGFGRLITVIALGGVLLFSIFVVIRAQRNAPNKSDAYAFSQSSPVGDMAYINIVSIEPVYCISSSNSSYYSDIVCRCTTEWEETVWLYISTSDYESKIDPSANLGMSYFSEFEQVDFSEPLQIYGIVKKADKVSSGLSSQTDALILEFDSIEENP